MRELLITNDLVVLSYAEALLSGAGVEATVFDANISMLEGSIGAFPRRVIVSELDWPTASSLLRDAGLGEWIVSREPD